MEKESLDMQKLSYFTEGNTFTGSRTKDRNAGTVLRYRACPDTDGEKLLVSAWTADVCFELAREREEAEFPLNGEGLEQALAWLEDRYRKL